MGSRELREFITEQALVLGAARVGMTDLKPPERIDVFHDWLKKGRHGTMAFMAKPEASHLRENPQGMLKSARSVICVALPYDAQTIEPNGEEAPFGAIARYAQGEDYHHVLWQLLDSLAQRITEHTSKTFAYRIAVDSAPVLERELAERAGLGFIGKNTMLISPGVGSYVFLGELFVELELEPTPTPKAVDCGQCRACLDACPTGALDNEYHLDANRCVSYLTIEHRGPIDESLHEGMSHHIFGCDICQSVCPYNKVAPFKTDILPAFKNKAPLRARPDLDIISKLGSNQRKRFVADSAMRRVNRESLQRNVAIALGNSGHPEAPSILRDMNDDRSQVVRDTVTSTLAKLGTKPS